MQKVRILCLEDNKLDAELITEVLESLPISPKVDHVDSGVSYREKLTQGSYDLILSDYSIPGFSGMDALHMAGSLAPETPFVFFSGTIGEDVAVDSLLQGAADYVLKQRPARLASAVTRALEVAELKRRQRASQDSLRFQADILNNVTDGVVATDSDGRVVYWNPGAEQIFKCSAKKMIMAPLGEAALEKVPGSFEHLIQKVRSDGRASDSFQCVVGEERVTVWVSVSARQLKDSGGRALGFLLIISDVSERKKWEEEVLRLNGELEAKVASRTADLADANEDLQRFGYSVSHDLSAAIRAVAGHAKSLQEDFADTLGEEGLHTVGRILNAAARMDQISRGLLRLARLSITPLELVQVNLTEVAKAVSSDLAELDKSRNVAWRIQENLSVHADELLLRSLVENLLGNAWKFTADRRNAVIELGLEETDQGQAFFVRDNGIGFDQEYANRLFEPFLRLHSENDYPGAGVGLSTAARIAERHYGKMWAVGSPGFGATFYFTLSRGPAR